MNKKNTSLVIQRKVNAYFRITTHNPPVVVLTHKFFRFEACARSHATDHLPWLKKSTKLLHDHFLQSRLEPFYGFLLPKLSCIKHP